MNSSEQKIYIVAGRDTDGVVFSRMLALELLVCGYLCTESDMIPSKGKADLVVADADSLTEAEKEALYELSVPVVFYSVKAYGGEIKNGASFITRPFEISSLTELISGSLSEPQKSEKRQEKREGREKGSFFDSGIPSVSVDKKRGCALFGGKTIELTAKEYELLSLLVSRRGEAVSKREISKAVWSNGEPGTNLTEVYIRYLRAKLDDRFGVKIIHTVRGKGYMVK